MTIPLRLSRSLASLLVLSGITFLAGSSFAAAALPAGAQSPQVDVMIKSPYLIYPGVVGQMEVLWQLAGTYTSTVEWGTDLTYSSGNAPSTEYGTANQHAFTFTGLLPATKYYYRITTLGTPYTGSFLSAPSSDAMQLKFLAYGDTRSYPDQHNTLAGQMLTLLNNDPAYQSFTLFMGDYVANGCTESYWSSEWFAFSYANIRNLTANLPYAGSMGNHETYPTGSQSLFPKYFPYPFAGSRYYYSFDYGPAHVTVLDLYPAGSSTGTFDTTNAQGLWFKNDLATTTKPWKFVLFHEPGWSASNGCGTGHANNAAVQQQIEPICERYGVAAVFCGHNHYYSRAVVNGIQHVTTGAGGAPFNTGCTTNQPNLVTYVGSTYEYCKIAIDGGVMHLDAINRATGAVIDSFTITRVIPDLTPPAVALTSPVGGEDWKAGSSHAITWTATDAVGVTGVDLAYSTNSGASFPNAIATGIANSGTFPWTVPDAPGDHVRVRVVAHDAAGNLGADSSASDLRISKWTIVASAGAGGAIVPSGAVPVVEGASQHFSIAPAPGHAVETLTVDGGPVAPDTAYTFTNVTADHTLNATFADTTAPVVEVTSPVGGEHWDIGTPQTITWTASGATAIDSVNVDYSSAGPFGPWLPVAHGLDNTGSVPWTVPGPASDHALVRVTAFDHAMHVGWDTSDSLFHVVDPSASVEGGPAVLALARPAPNPGRGSALLRFSLPAAGRARLEIIDAAGRRLWRYEADLDSGDHSVRWNGANDSGGRVGAGLYFVRLVTPWGTRTQRLALRP